VLKLVLPNILPKYLKKKKVRSKKQQTTSSGTRGTASKLWVDNVDDRKIPTQSPYFFMKIVSLKIKGMDKKIKHMILCTIKSLKRNPQ
jgi:hypothetical protein